MTSSGFFQGQKFGPVTIDLEPDALNALEGACRVGVNDGQGVHPGLLASRVLTALFDVLVVPPGTIHAAQEFSFAEPVAVGSRLICSAHVTSVSHRQRITHVVLEITAQEASGGDVVKGRSTFVIAASEPLGSQDDAA